MQKQPYGSKWSVNHPEAYRIWLSSETELPPLPPGDLRCFLVDDVDHAEAQSQADALWKSLELLTPRQEKIMLMRYKLDMTLDEIAYAFDVTRERIRQIEQQSLMKLRRFDSIKAG